MSQLRARNGSQLRAGQGSPLKAYGLGFKTFTEELESAVSMTWTAKVYRWNVTQDTESSQGNVNVIFGPYFGQAFLGPPGRYAGKNELGGALGRAYNGAPDPANDTVSVPTNMTYPANVSGGGFSWRHWQAMGSLPQEPFFETTPTSMIFRSHIEVRGSTNQPYQPMPRGMFNYGHAHFMVFSGNNYFRDPTLEFITLYFDGLPSFNIGFPSGQDQIRCVIRLECEVTA